MNNGFSKIFVAIFFIALLVSLPVNPLAVPSAGAQVFDPNTNLGKQLVKEVRGDTYLTKEYSDSTAESTFGLPEWIPDDNGDYKPYIIMENNDAYVIENKYLPMGINKSNCMTTFYLNNENILDGADTLIENQYWEVYHKENETDNYQLLDTSSWDCDTSFNTSSKQFSIFTTWDKSHGDSPLAQSQYDTTSTNSTGTFYFKTLSETTNNPTSSQQVITNSTGTFTVDVWTDNFTTTTQNIPVIPDELISTFEVEYRYMLETGDVESFTRIINNDANMENHYFQFVNKFDGVNYNSFNLGDDIEFTDASYIGSYYATAENVPDKYIQIAEQGYPLYYSLEKGEEWWTGAGATIYMDGAEKKLNVQVDFGKDRTPLPLNTLQELDPTFSATHTNVMGVYSLGSNSCLPSTMATFTTTDYTVYLANTGNSGGTCSSPSYQWDVSSIADGSVVSDVDLDFTVSAVSSSYGCDIYDISNDITSASASTLYTDMRDGTNYVNNDTSCTSTGAKSFDLGSSADTEVSTALTGDDLFGVGVTFDTWSRDGTNRSITITTSTVQLTVTYELPTVTAPPTNLAGADVSTSAINLSWTAPSTASATIPAVTGYRVQSSDFAFANSSLPTGRTADSDSYGALTGDVDMVNANLYLSMNGTQQFGTDNGIGSSADGTNYGGTTGETGKLSNAWGFDGTNDWINLGTGLNSYIDGNPFTISAWAYVTATNISDRTVIGKQIAGYSSPYHVLNLRAYSGDWALTTNNASTYTGCTNAIDSTGWTHLAVQFDGTSSFTLYENGASACTFSASGTNWSSSYWSIGNGEGTTRYFNDKIDQVLFYNSDSVSISDLYNSGSGTSSPSTTNLIAHYDFDEGTRQGYGGGMSTSNWGGGGGGGAGSAGSDSSGSGSGTNGANGGDGRSSDITGSAVIYSAGGGGGGGSSGSGGAGGSSGVGGAGTGSSGSAGNGATNTGSGGGSGRTNTGGGGDGADGVVILRFTTSGNTYSQAGGTVSTSGSDTIISWTATSGTTTFTPTSEFNVRYLIVAGGGGGFSGNTDSGQGGGGAGGMLEQSVHAVTAQTYTIVVGAGGAGGSGSQVSGVSGSDSSFDSITATGGGYGTGYGNQSINGGSGGGTGGSGNSWSYGETSSLTNKALESDIKMLDESYRGNHATLSGGIADGTNNGATTGATGKLSNAWSFDGSNDYVSIPSMFSGSSDTGDAFTVNVWVNADVTTSNGAIWYHDGYAYLTFHNANNIRYAGTGTSLYLTSSVTIPDDTWAMITLVQDTNTAKLYVDGVERASGSGHPTYSSGNTYIGTENNTGDYFNGDIDQMLFYDTALDATAITNLYNGGSGTSSPSTTNLIAHYDFEQTGDLENQFAFPISKDTDLNFEGTSSSDFDGSTHYMTLPSDNTIISTTGAFTLGTWVKPDTITLNPLINYGFEDGSTTLDNTGSGGSTYDGTGSGTTTGVTGKVGSAWDFEQSDSGDHIVFGSSASDFKFLHDGTAWTLSAWINMESLGERQWFNNVGSATNNGFDIISTGGNDLRVRIHGSGTICTVTASHGMSAGSWHLLNVVHDGSSLNVLIDGSSIGTASCSSHSSSNPSYQLNFGRTADGYGQYFDGMIDQLVFFSGTALSNDYLSRIYNSGSGISDPTKLTSTIFSYPSSAGSVDFNIEGDDLAFRSGDKNNDPIITRTHGMNDGSWNNVAVSRDGSNNFEIFVNGTRVGAVASNSTAINAKTSGENYYIGLSASPPSADYSFTNNGATSGSTGKLGNAWDFEDGEGDYIDTTNLITNNAMGSTGTVSFWYKQESHQGSYLWSVGDSDGNTDRIYIEQQATNKWVVTAQYNSGASAWKVDSTTSPAFADDTWYHVVVTHDGGSSYGAVKLWINGVDRSTNSNNGSAWNNWVGDLTNIDNMRFGNHNHNNLVYTQYADGLYDDIGIWDRALTSAEVASLYNSGTGAVASTISSGLKAYYPLDDSSLTNKALENSNYFDGKMDEMYVLSTQSDTVIDNISSRGENSWTDLSYNTGGTGTTYSHTGISGGSGTYQSYRVSAHNSVGLSGFDLAEESTSSTPSVPQSLAVAPQMNGDTFENKLTWSNPASEGGSSISNFKVYRGTSSGFTANSGSLITTLGDVFTYTDSGLDGRTSYYYIVSAVNTQGEGTKTSEVQGTTKNFNVIVKGVRFDNSTALAGYVLQTNSTSANNKFTFNSTGFTIGRTLSDGTIDGSDRMTGLFGNQNFTMFDTGNSFTVKKIVNKNIAENKVTNDSWVHAQSNVFDIDCSSNGAGSDVRLYVNGTIGHVQTMTTPSCDSDNIITWDSTFTAHGATTGVGDVSLNSLVIAEVLSTGKFGVNAQSLTYGLWNSTSQSTISTTTLGTTYSAPEITSAVLPVSKPTVTTIYNMTMTLDTIAVTPSGGGGGGGGGGGSPSEGGILGGLQEFIDETFEFNMASKIHKVELGQTITDSISVSWNQPEEVNIIGIDAGRYNSWFGFQKTPFTLLGDSEGFSNAKIPYKIRIPEVYCDDTTGRTMCAEPILYEVPVLVTGQVNDEVFRGETVVKIDLSKSVQPALFAIFLAFAGGIGAIVYRVSASSKSSKPSGKRTPKKKGSFLRELNKDYKK